MCGDGSALAAFIKNILFTVSAATVVGDLGQDLDQDRSENGVLGRLEKVELEGPVTVVMLWRRGVDIRGKSWLCLSLPLETTRQVTSST